MPESDAGEPRAAVYLEDVAVGQRFVTRSHVVTEADVLRFAREFDPQPFHTDREAATHSVFGGLVASGWHTVAITMRLMVEDSPRFAWGLVGVGAEAQWPAPTRPGDTLTVHGEVVDITPSRSRPDRGIVTVRSETRKQGDVVVQVLTAKLMVPRRSAPAP